MKTIEKIAFFLIPLSVLFSSSTIIPNRILVFSLLLITLVRQKFFLSEVLDKKWWVFSGLFVLLIIIFGNKQIAREAVLFLTIPIYWIIYKHSSLSLASHKRNYIFSVFIFSIILLLIKLYKIVVFGINNFLESEQWWNLLMYKNLSIEIDGHPTYISMFIISALVLLLQQKEFGKVFLTKHQYILIQLVLLLVLFLFAVKISYLVSMLILLTYLGFIIHKKSKKTIGFAILFIILAGILTYQTPGIKQRMLKDLQALSTSTTEVNKENKLKERIALWKASIQFIKNNPTFGTSFLGISSKSGIYPVAKIYYPKLEQEKNCHNNFLEFGVRYGIIGFVLFLFIFLLFWRIGIQQHSFEIIGILILLTFFSLTESFMFRELGVSFTAILMSIFGIQLYGKNI